MAHEALLSLAMPSSSALRPSMSRRLTSLPRVAPTIVAARIDDQRHFRLGIVPVGVRPDADLRAVAHRGHGRRLGEDLGVGADADLEIGRPGAARHQGLLERLGLGRARLDGGDVGADDLVQLLAHLLGARRIALGVLLDQPLEQAHREGDAGRLDRLQVDRRQKVSHKILERAQAVALGIAGKGHGIGRIAEVGHRGRRRGDVVDAVGAHRHDAGPGGLALPPDPADQGSGGAVVRQDIVGRSWHGTSPFLT